MKTLYIVFSATGYKTGRFIRVVTRGSYNHVSVALDPDLCEVYSFGRLKRGMPFCAGFVREGAERFRWNNSMARIAVCAVDIDDARMEEVRRRLDEMCSGQKKYVYNMISAVCVPFRRQIVIRDSYTCIEFALSILKTAGLPLGDSYYSITDLYELLRHCEIYRGEYPASAYEVDSSYNDDVPMRTCVSETTRQLWRLTYRFVRH